MLCLHGEKCYVGSTIKNGTFWYCAHLSSSCHFKCTEDDAELYAKAVKEFLATKQDRPKCCAIKSTLMTNGVSVEMPHLGRRYAKMKVVTDTKKVMVALFSCAQSNHKTNDATTSRGETKPFLRGHYVNMENHPGC